MNSTKRQDDGLRMTAEVGCDDASTLAGKAAQCRRLASGVSDRQASEILRKMADGYDESAIRLQQG